MSGLNRLTLVLLCALSCPGISAAEPETVDLIVEGDYVVTMDLAGKIIERGALAIRDGNIVDIGAADRLNQKYRASEILPGTGRIVMPGLINGHAHSAMTLLRGIADDLSLYEWLNEYIFPAEVAFVDQDFVSIGTQLACWEMIRGGTTTFVDMYYFPNTITKVVEDCGMRALVSATVIDQQSPDAENAEDSLQKAIAFVEQQQGKNPRITPIFGPHANYTLNARQLQATRTAARKLGTTISIHMSESPFETEYSNQTYGMGSVSMFDSIGFFNGPTVAAHMVWPTDDEIEILAKRGVGVIYNPTSNMKTAAGIAPIVKMLEAGIPVGLGTDGAASNNDLDMWEEMRLGALLQKVAHMNPELLPAADMLAMATRNGARAIGLDEKVGTLEVGMRADVIQVSFEDVHHIPTYDIISHLVYVSDEQDVITTIVDGHVLMRDGTPLTINQARVREEATRLAAAISRKLAERQQPSPSASELTN